MGARGEWIMEVKTPRVELSTVNLPEWADAGSLERAIREAVIETARRIPTDLLLRPDLGGMLPHAHAANARRR